jgi:hypothetical protein
VFRVGTGGLGALTLTNTQIVMAAPRARATCTGRLRRAATLTDSASRAPSSRAPRSP